MFGKAAEKVKKDKSDLEDSDISEVAQEELLKTLKELEELEADLIPTKKKLPIQKKSVVDDEPVKDSPGLESNANLKGEDEATGGRKKLSTGPSSSAHPYDDFFDQDDLLGNSLDDLLPDETRPEPKSRQSKPDKSLLPASASPTFSSQTAKTSKKDDKDHLLDALGFERHKKDSKKKEAPLWSSTENDVPQRPRTRITDILEASDSARPLDQPHTGEGKEEKVQQEKHPSLKDDFTFGTYKPTEASTAEGRQSRRQSVRFSTEDVRVSTPEKKPQPSASTTSRHRGSAEWLGLTINDEPDYFEGSSRAMKSSASSPKAPSSPAQEKKSLLNEGHATSAANVTGDAPNSKTSRSEVSKDMRKDEEKQHDWFEEALSRKKTLSETKASKQEGSRQTEPAVSNEDMTPTFRDREETFTSTIDAGPVAHSTPVREEKPNKDLQQNQIKATSAPVQQQASYTANNLQQLLLQQQIMQTQLLGLGSPDEGALQRLKDKEQQQGECQALRARIIQLEGEVKLLQLEREQSQLVLENIQQMHKQEMQLLENSHKTRVKLLEEAAAQRESRARLECEELMERLATLTRSAEQERSELQAHYHRKLAQAQQDRDREVERLQDLQRKSILEMKKDHEDQLQRLKRLKDEEIDAVTSATSQTRSLVGVIEQMEHFSSRLGELSSQVKSQEQADLKLRLDEVKQKELAVTQEKETLARLRAELDREREVTNSIALRLKTRAQEVEAFSKIAAERYEEGERALEEAKRVESGHEARLKNIQLKTENLRQLEQQIMKEGMRLNRLKREAERLREHSPILPSPQIIPPILPGVISSVDSVSVPPVPEVTNPSSSLASYQPMMLEASLALWKYTAAKDDEFLRQEQMFLENLQRNPYKFNPE
ncbi:PREDICTED: fas-binding factor 1 isoform X2 [Cyprinodon variegatus]|uniref:fas-binding factor 1 isoform X2 n=1 Tax=Cyprinodon variegatus TaxID=28743 RepID=UPI000742AEE3|nr:PREDICTED: fas-binding factor 1 isoform X2 [Cyprinodon variegatus]